MSNYIFYQTKTEFNNTGDTLINKALLDTLREYGKLQCNCSKDIPERFLKQLQIKEDEKIHCKNELQFVLNILLKSIKKDKNDKVYIVSGLGHNFGGGFKKSARNIVASILFMIYRLFGVRIVRIGSSIGPITKVLGFTEKIRSIPINEYFVRDTQSLELCHKIGIKKAKLCPDMSWLYLKGQERKINETTTVILNPRDWGNKSQENETILRIGEILKEFNKKMNKKMKLIFLYQVKKDKDISKRMYDHFKDTYQSEFVEEQVNLDTAKEYYCKASYNISDRMHSLLLGYKYGALPVAVIDTDKNVKIGQTFKDANLEKLIIDIYKGKTENVLQILENKDMLMNKLLDVEKDKQKEITNILDKIF